MVGQPKLRRRQTDRWIIPPLSVCSWVNPVPIYALLLGLIISPVIASSTGLERPKYRTAYACEGSTLNMDCDQGHVINLIRANYGRFSITICNEHGNTEWSVNCMSLRSHRVLHDRCSQRQNCSVPASTRGFGDPCPGTLKYLEAHFQCVPVNPPSHTARPRPPWFLPSKTTVSSITEDHDDPHRDTPFPRDPPKGMFPEMPHNEGILEETKDDDDKPFKSLSSTTTTTIRPPPWLITNTTKNTTSLSTTLTTTSNLKSSTTTSSTTTTPTPPTLEEPESSNANAVSSTSSPAGVEEESGSNSRHEAASEGESLNGMPDTEEEEEGKKVPSSTISTTNSWEPKIDLPDKGLIEKETYWCPPSSGRGLFWNWTRSGEVATQPCPGGASGQATRPCSLQGWVSPPDLGMCRSVWLTTLLTRSEDKDSVLAIAQDLTQVTESRKLYGGDITAAGRLVSELTERMGDDVSSFPDRAQLEALVTELVAKALTTVSNLFGRQRLAWGDLRVSEHSYAITKLLLGLEEAAFFLADNIHKEKTVTHAVPNILMRLQVLETRNVAPVTFPSPDDPWPLIESTDPSYPNSPYSEEGEMFALSPSSMPSSEAPSLNANPQRHLQDFITLPPEALLENSDNGLVKMVFFSYEGLHKLLQPERSYGYNHGGYQSLNRTRILNSRVISASLGAGRHIELSEPVYITFAMIRTVNVTNPACVFWDYTTSLWSEEGCRVLRFNRTHTTCQCDHLTNFAVLMDVHATPMSSTHQVALSVITYVGCIISIVCLLLATIVFHAFRGLKNDRTTIHKNLCICLMLGEALFVGGISRTDQPLVCGVVAGFLHYLFLAAFAWMFLEGFQLYVMLSEVFEAEKSRVKWYYATAYGFPALVVAVSAVIDPDSYGTETVCWLRTDNYFIFAFVGPVLLVLLANSVFLTLSLILMCRHAQNSAVLKNKETTRLSSLRSWIRGAVILMFLLGLTWTFGLLYLDQASVAMAYVFTILNSLQGLFIFVFHCLQNDKKYSFKSCGRDSGHGGSEQEESPRTGPPAKLSSLRHNNNVTQLNDHPQLVNPFAAAAALEHSPPNPAPLLTDYRLASDASNMRYPAGTLPGIRVAHRNQSPWNHTYTEIPDGLMIRPIENNGPDPVYEEIEREGRSEIQVSDLSDEDGRRQNSDISRQSSRSYGDHRPLLPYTLPDHSCPQSALTISDPRFQQRLRHPDAIQLSYPDNHTGNRIHPSNLDHTIVSGGHLIPIAHPSVCSSHHPMHHGNGHVGVPMDSQQYKEAVMAALGHGTGVQPLSEPNLRSWEAVQRHRDLQQLQHLGEMTVAVLNGEQVVCKLKSPLAPIHENSSPLAPTSTATATLGVSGSANNERFLAPQTYSHC